MIVRACLLPAEVCRRAALAGLQKSSAAHLKQFAPWMVAR